MRRLVVLTLLSATHLSAVAASEPAIEARNGMVVSSRHLVSDIGVEILKHGGSAVDSVVAVGYAQALANLCCGSIDGGLMTIRLADGRGGVINFREATPAAASANTYLNESGNVRLGESLHGYRAVGMPGTVAGLDLAQSKYGNLTRKHVIAPEIRLARDELVLTRADTDILDTTVQDFNWDLEAVRILLLPDDNQRQPEDRLVPKDLAHTLTRSTQNRPIQAFATSPDWVPAAACEIADAYVAEHVSVHETEN